MPIYLRAIILGRGCVIGLPCMPSCVCNVRRKATEDRLPAVQCGPICRKVTVPGSPRPPVASQHQHLIFTSPLAPLTANIDGLGTDNFLIVREGGVVFECSARSDGEMCRHMVAFAGDFCTSICMRHLGVHLQGLWGETAEYLDNDVDVPGATAAVSCCCCLRLLLPI